MKRVLIVTHREHCAIRAGLKLLQDEIHRHGRILTADIQDLATSRSAVEHLDIQEIEMLLEVLDGDESEVTPHAEIVARSVAL